MADAVLLCGIDEAGRGPLAGPVYAAAVILGKNFNAEMLDDSKKLTALQRGELRHLICAGALAWGVGYAGAAEIDRINIHNATLLAMKRAYEQMLKFLELFGSPDKISFDKLNTIVDGLFVPEINGVCSAMVKADAKVPEVMAASILAKTARDRLMLRCAKMYPVYGYEKHKGYPTKEHRAAILKYGPSPIQRMTFTVSPVN